MGTLFRNRPMIACERWIIEQLVIFIIYARSSSDRYAYFFSEPLLELVIEGGFFAEYHHRAVTFQAARDETLVELDDRLSQITQRIHKTNLYPELVFALCTIRNDVFQRTSDLIKVIGLENFIRSTRSR